MGDSFHPPEDFGPAFDAAAARLRAAVGEACSAGSGPWPARVCAVIDAALRFAADDPAATRLLLVDSWGQGEEAVARREALLDHFASLLASGCERGRDDADLPAVAEEFLVGAVAARIARSLSDARPPAPYRSVLRAELIEFVLLHYLDPADARLWSRRAHLPPRSRGGPATAADLRSVPFAEVLSLLQGLIGVEVGMVVNLPGHFFDCGFSARLERVETLSGDDGPVLLVFAGVQGIALDPADFDCFLARWPGTSGYAWLELRLGDLLHLVIEPLSEPK
ncbi:MAG TPA: hypothetical protein VJ989_05265 [Solirubrobacterales bacterium]|nr:hypothetical protein [Solirubrobacterales bacterium]